MNHLQIQKIINMPPLVYSNKMKKKVDTMNYISENFSLKKQEKIN